MKNTLIISLLLLLLPINYAIADTNERHITFYNTWSSLPQNGAFFVVGVGMNSYSPTFHISDSRITISGKYGYTNENVYTYNRTDDKGNRVYRCVKNIPYLSMMWEIGITPNYKALNIVYYNNNQIVSIDNFVSSLDLRNQVIAEKKHLVNNGVNNPTTGDRLTPDNNPNSGRRYPESSICPNCKGTKVESFPMYENDPSGAAVNAGRQIGYTNSRGHLCKYCGKYTWHIHLKCYKCN